ncbi:hypothetical protein LQW54_001788 [Pestalotiopsis sp. IQ-011]
MLHVNVKKQLPELVQEIEKLRNTCQSDLEELGEPRTTFQQQQRYLIEVVQSFQQLVRSGIDGDWSDDFFKETPGVGRRIRAIIQNKNEVFARKLPSGDRIRDIDNENLEDPSYLASDESFEYMSTKIRKSRGRQLPGSFHSEVVADVFHDQAAPWQNQALRHVHVVWKAYKEFLEDAVDYVADVRTSIPLKDKILHPAMKSIQVAMELKTKEISAAHQNTHLISYNDDFTKALEDTTRQRERDRVTEAVTETLRQFFGVKDLSNTISKTLVRYHKQSLDDF